MKIPALLCFILIFNYVRADLLITEVVESNANNVKVNPSEAINIPADAQKQGAVVTGGWTCAAQQYHVTMKAWILDTDGGRSNAVQYTVHCNGG